MSEILLTLNSIALPIDSGGDLRQDYEEIGGFTTRRLANGAALPQSRWSRLRTTLSCTGWKPATLAGIDWRAPVTIGCIAPLGIIQASHIFTLPANRRSDVAVVAMSIHGPDSIPAAVSVVSNTATVTVASGADAYACYWYPLLTCYSPGPKARLDLTSGQAGWELTAEES